MTQQKFAEPKCAQTGRPFYPVEQQDGETHVSVLCSECGEVLAEHTP